VDKIKMAFAWAKKNRFWISSLLLAALMIGCWVFAANTIDASTQKYVADVKGKISAAESIMKVSAEEGVLVHPNTTTEQGMRELLEQSADEIVKAWKLRYDAQGKILQWPKEILADKDFCEHFNKHNPPETYPIESERGIEPYSILYLNKIPQQMERICAETLRAKWNFDPKYSKSTYVLTPEEELSRFAVVWDETNQQLWRNKLTRFRGFDDHAGSIDGPTGLQIYMLQQDLWLLEAMFEVIREINGDVSANDLAKIKRIDHVAFGREARIKLGELTPIRAGVIESTEEEVIPDDATATEATGDAVEGDFDPSASRKSFNGRYVNAAFLPISADEVLKVLQAVKSGSALPDSSLELIVAKRVPVRIALKMDEREIPNFMTACANSPFAFEIHQVRKNRHTPGQGIVLNGGGGGGVRMSAGASRGDESRSRGAPGKSAGGLDSSGLGGMEGRGGSSGGASSPGTTKDVETRTNYDIDVEFYGIVKIYNPVAEDYLRKLIGGDATADPQASTDPAKYSPRRSRPWQLALMNRWMPNILTN
jgi:hypothetical protein